MYRRLGAVSLVLSALGILALLGYHLVGGGGPEAQARAALRRSLSALSPNWRSAGLEYSPSEGCGYSADATWSEGGVGYAFSTFRYPGGMGGGALLSVRLAKDAPKGDRRALASYRFRADGTLAWTKTDEGVGVELGWAVSRAREFFRALPRYE